MKRLSLIVLYCFFLAICFLSDIYAQDNKGKRLQFIYIDHEVTTPTALLNSRITDRRNDVIQFPNRESLIVYLSNGGRRSPTAFVNLKEYLNNEQLERISASGNSRDSEAAFKTVLEMLNNANSHTVDARADVQNILDMLDHLNVYDENGKLNYRSLRFDFYIGPQFWQLRNNEKVIARLYSVLRYGLSDEDKDKISFNVLKSEDVSIEYDEENPFGISNLDDINSTIQIMEY